MKINFLKKRWIVLILTLLGVLVILGAGTAYLFSYISSYPVKYPDRTLDLAERAEVFINKIVLPIKLVKLAGQPPDTALVMPVYGINISDIEDTWGAARSEGRSHEGQDIFAPTGTPIFSATNGYVIRIGWNDLGGNSVTIAGAGGVRYYYTHLDSYPRDLREGDRVGLDTVVGFVGNTGNAATTPPHLHFGAYKAREAFNPYPLLVDR